MQLNLCIHCLSHLASISITCMTTCLVHLYHCNANEYMYLFTHIVGIYMEVTYSTAEWQMSSEDWLLLVTLSGGGLYNTVAIMKKNEDRVLMHTPNIRAL